MYILLAVNLCTLFYLLLKFINCLVLYCHHSSSDTVLCCVYPQLFFDLNCSLFLYSQRCFSSLTILFLGVLLSFVEVLLVTCSFVVLLSFIAELLLSLL